MIVECTGCEARVDAEVLASYESYDPESGPPARYSFLRCHTCRSPFLVVQENYGEGWDEPADRIYPVNTRVNPMLPTHIRNAFSEALTCFRGKAFTAAAIMCRKTLEGVCAEHGVQGQTLVDALRTMKEKGIIESRLYEWADTLRKAGNEAAHDVRVAVGKDDAQDIVEFTNAFLEYVFTFRDKFEQFKIRRARTSRGE